MSSWCLEKISAHLDYKRCYKVRRIPVKKLQRKPRLWLDNHLLGLKRLCLWLISSFRHFIVADTRSKWDYPGKICWGASCPVACQIWETLRVCEDAVSAETLPTWTEKDMGRTPWWRAHRLPADSTRIGEGDLRTAQRNLKIGAVHRQAKKPWQPWRGQEQIPSESLQKEGGPVHTFSSSDTDFGLLCSQSKFLFS